MGGHVTDDTFTQLAFTADAETWIVDPYVLVSVGGGISNPGVLSAHNANTLINNGNIYAQGSNYGVAFTGNQGKITNNDGALIKGGSGIGLAGDGSTIDNHGTIFGFAGVDFAFQANHSVLNNTGKVLGKAFGVYVDSSGSEPSVIHNSGLIQSPGDGIHASINVGAGRTVVVDNQAGGTVEGGSHAIFMNNGNLSLTNRGTLDGGIDCNGADQNDAVVNFGTIVGNVFLGSGNDLFNATTGTSGAVFGEDGIDTFFSGSKANAFLGGNQNDTFVIVASNGLGDGFNGGPGLDKLQVLGTAAVTLSSFSAANSIEQWAGNSKGILGTSAANSFNFSGLTSISGWGKVDAGAGNDTITGSKLADTLLGGPGTDALLGGSGTDTLTGGTGKDTLTGGTQRDVFDFNAIGESAVGPNHDVINAFQHGLDDIDLSTIDADIDGTPGNQKFAFIGALAFTGTDGQLRCSGGIIQGDVNGDKVADFEIKVNVATMATGDFIL